MTFDITNEKSFQNTNHWILSIFKMKPRDIPIILVGNKVDLEEKRAVSKSDVEKIKQEFGLNYHETSALAGTGVTEMMTDIMRQVYLQKFDSGATGSTAATSVNTNTGSNPSQQTDAVDKDRPSFMLGGPQGGQGAAAQQSTGTCC